MEPHNFIRILRRLHHISEVVVSCTAAVVHLMELIFIQQTNDSGDADTYAEIV